MICELLGVPTEDRADFCRWQIEAKQLSKRANEYESAVPLEEIQPLREAVAGAVSELPVAW